MKFDAYDSGFKIVSLAISEEAKMDLIEDRLDFVFYSEGKVYLYPGEIELNPDEGVLDRFSECCDYDVFEIWPNGSLHQKYSEKSTDNYFFVTSKCNSNCIMCPSPEESRRKGVNTAVEDLIELVNHIPDNTPHLTITGGEPFMMGDDIFILLEACQKKFKRTQFLLLSNGRAFAIKRIYEQFMEVVPDNMIVAIPIHGSCAVNHDLITQVKGSFEQSIIGIKRLIRSGISVEIRIVVSYLNVFDFSEIAKMIINDLPGVEYISVIAMEMTGNAWKNRTSVWIPYNTAFMHIESGIHEMINNGVDVRIYNFPLCTVDSKYWNICEKSISPDKVRYAEQCEGCKYKETCGGIFAGTISMVKDELKAII
jgi:His-Xaa-Ser system radical SAM maturase HxsC